MKVLGIYGGPRKGGNSEFLLDKVLEGAEAAGAEVETIRAAELDIGGCLECGGCDETGECVLDDDMNGVYPLLDEAEVIFLAGPIFFYALPAQVKALIDRSQARWSKRRLEKTPEERKRYDSGVGYLISVGATKGAKLFDCAELTAKYFYDALDMDYGGGLFYRGVEAKGQIVELPGALEEAFEFGRSKIAGA